MTQYIDKAAVLAEIERMLQKEYPCDNSEQEAGYDFALYELQDFLNTLEVKEVEEEFYIESKKVTIMDTYEKKYKEALAHAREIHRNEDEKRRDMEFIFPELKESEDERIRKALIENFKWYCGDFLETTKWGKDDNLLVKDIIAWLEKQGQILANSCKSCKDEQKSTETVKWSAQEEYCICELEAMVKEAWRNAENVRNDVTIKKMQELMFFLKTLNPNKKPQRIISAEAKEALYDKPAWSKEDEKELNSCIEAIEACYKWDTMVDWLKSLKDRIIPQPKQEWSEEDENVLEDIEEAIINYWHGDTQDILLDWLKSLKERIK